MSQRFDDPAESLPPARLARPERPPLDRRRLLTLSGLALALVAVVAGAGALLLAAPPGTSHPKATTPVVTLATRVPTTTPTFPPTATPAPPPPSPTALPFPPPGWVATGPSFATTITFAPGHPQIGYVCGDVQKTTLDFAATADGGASWSPGTALPASVSTQGSCQIAVDPTNPRDVVVLINPCTGDCGPNPLAMIRSLNGGQSWKALTVPDSTNYGFGTAFGFAGGTLYANIAVNLTQQTLPPPPPHPLVVSVAGAAFAWADLPAGTPGTRTFAYRAPGPSVYISPIANFFGVGNEMIATIAPSGANSLFLVTTDNGTTWSTLALQNGLQAYTFVAASADGQWMAATTPDNLLAISKDRGVTWDILPPSATPNQPANGGFNPGQLLLIAPDGTTLTVIVTSTSELLAESDPNAIQWQLLGVAPNAGGMALAINAAGHPTALWAALYNSSANSGFYSAPTECTFTLP